MPLFHQIEAKTDAYVWATDIGQMVREQKVSRIVRYGGLLRSVQMTGGGWLKPVDRFHPRHVETAELLGAFLGECLEHEIAFPSSYNAIFRQRFYSPRIPFSINAGLLPHVCGGWEEAKQTGFLPNRWRQYDLNGAYRWAACQGLPDPATFEASKDRVSVRRPGIYVLKLTGNDAAPYPYNRPGWAAVSDAEIESYNLTWTAQRFGVSWSGYLPLDAVEKVLGTFTFGNEMAKTFWGMWAAQMPIESYYPRKDTTVLLRPITLNLVWAHRLISLVKLRVWEQARNACHVFCDSIITTDTLTTSQKLGDWKLVQEFPDGLYVGGAGRYGLTATNLIKQSGVPRVANN